MVALRHGVSFAASIGEPTNLVAWDDLSYPATGINLAGAGGEPTRDATTGLLEFPATGTTTFVVHPQMRHAWMEGSPLGPHVHWRKKTAGAGNVVWRIEYEFQNVNDVFTDTYTSELASTPVGDVDFTTAKRHLITPFSQIDMTDKRISCCGIVRVSRMGDDGGDTYAGVAQLQEFDIHYMIDAFGSEEEYIKGDLAFVP